MALFAASVDDAETNRKFAESLELEFPILSDPDKKVVKELGVLHESGKYAERRTIYIDKDGKVKFIDTKVSVRTHGADIAAKLADLGFPRRAAKD